MSDLGVTIAAVVASSAYFVGVARATGELKRVDGHIVIQLTWETWRRVLAVYSAVAAMLIAILAHSLNGIGQHIALAVAITLCINAVGYLSVQKYAPVRRSVFWQLFVMLVSVVAATGTQMIFANTWSAFVLIILITFGNHEYLGWRLRKLNRS